MKKLLTLTVIIGLSACANTATEHNDRYTQTLNHCNAKLTKASADKVCDCWAQTVANSTTDNVDISHCVKGITLETKE